MCKRLHYKGRSLVVSDPATVVDKAPWKWICCWKSTQFLHRCSIDSIDYTYAKVCSGFIIIFGSDRFVLERVITEYSGPLSSESPCITSKTMTSSSISSKASESYRWSQLVTVGTSGIVEIYEPDLSGVYCCVCAEQHDNRLQLWLELTFIVDLNFIAIIGWLFLSCSFFFS